MRYMIETERSDLFDVSIVIAMRVHIKGNVNEDGLRSAFEEATKAYEILGCRVVLEEDGTAYYENENFEGKKEGNSVTSSNSQKCRNNKIFFEESSWRQILKREEKIRFKIEESEFLKAFCYKMNEEG